MGTLNNNSLKQRIYFSTLWIILVIATIYLFTAVMIFSGLYLYVWPLLIVGLLAVIHLIAIPVGYLGYSLENRALLLVTVLLCTLWLILIIVYVIVFMVYTYEDNDFKHRPLHHVLLSIYSLLDITILVIGSMAVAEDIQSKSEKSKSGTNKTL